MKRLGTFFGLLLLCLAGCGDEDSTGPGSRERGTSHIVLERFDSAREGARVLRHSPQGEFLAATTVDELGMASLEIEAGDWITARDFFGGVDSLVVLDTIVGAGIDETIDFYGVPAPNGAGARRDVAIIGTPPQPWVSYAYSTGCGGGSASAGVPETTWVWDLCRSDSGLFHVFARTGWLNGRRAFNYAVDVPLNPSGETTVVELDDEWSTDWQPVQIGLPTADLELTNLSTGVWQDRDGQQIGGNLGGYTWNGGELPESYELNVPGGFPDHLLVSIGFGMSNGTNVYLEERVPVSSETERIDSPTTFPQMTSVHLDASNPERPIVRWELDRGDVDGDAVILMVEWESGRLEYQWTIYLPPETDEFRFPQMESEDVAVMPSPENLSSSRVEFSDDTFIGGFTAFRQRPYASVLSGANYEAHSRPGSHVETWITSDDPSGLRQLEEGDRRTAGSSWPRHRTE